MTRLTFHNDREREQYFGEFCGKYLNEYFFALKVKGLFTAPASTKFHGTYQGGLFDHSANVAHALYSMTIALGLSWEREESPYIIGMLHDLCKVDQYKFDVEKDGYVWNNDPVIKGHGMKSVIYAQHMGIRLTDEEIACIAYHMGAYCPKEEWGDYDNAIRKYPNVLWTHTADMTASKIWEV